VAGQEGDPPAADVADGDGRRRRPVGGVDGHLDGVVEERVEAGTAEDADLGCPSGDTPTPGGRGRGHAILVSVLAELPDDDESEDDEDDDDDEDEESEDDEEDELDSESLGFDDPFFAPPRLSVL
jgi:hypothetical protein